MRTSSLFPPPSTIDVGFYDSQALDSFQRLRISKSGTLFDSQQEYGLDTLQLWDVTANGTLPTVRTSNGSVISGSNQVGPRDLNTRLTPITCSTTNGHYSILQSRQYCRYIPGFSQFIVMTGIFASGGSYTAAFTRRTSTSGSVSDTDRVEQINWNIDKFDGTGPSRITLDLTKIQILWIGAQWLGTGRVIVGFDVGGRLYPAHEFNHANVLTVPYTQTFNLPARMEIRNTTAAESKARFGYFDHANGIYLETVRAVAGGTVYFNCCSVQTEGGVEERGAARASFRSSSVAVTTRRPVFSIRPAENYHQLTNRAQIELADFWLHATTNDSLYEIIYGGTLTGASWNRVNAKTPIVAGSFAVGIGYRIVSVGTTDFTLIGASANTIGVYFTATGVGVGTGTATPDYSCAEFDVSATAISGGELLIAGTVITGSGAKAGGSFGDIDVRLPFVLSKIDALAAEQIPVTIVCTSLTGTSNILAGINHHEQVT